MNTASLDLALPLLEVRNLSKHYALPRRSLFEKPGQVQALSALSFCLQKGKSLGIVGESGSGKSTLAKLVMALETPSAGQVLFQGQDLSQLDAGQLREARKSFQMVFQDPFGSLDPRQTVLNIVCEPLDPKAKASREEDYSFASPRAKIDAT